MYCRYCGKEVDDDSKFCRYCGANIVDISLVDNFAEHNDDKSDETINNPDSVNDPVVVDFFKDSEPISETKIIEKEESHVIIDRPLPLIRRFFGSLIDKILILIIAVVGYIACKPYAGTGDIGYFMALMNSRPSTYEYIDKLQIDTYGTIYEGIDIEYQMKAREESEVPYIGYSRDFEIKMCSIFIIVNLIYYLLFELTLRASLGKEFLGGKLVNEGNDRLSYWRIPLRSLVFVTLTASIFYEFRYLVEANYYIIIAVFFLCMDLPLFVNKRSLLDICTRTMYVDILKKEDNVGKYGKPDIEGIKKSLKE